MSMVSATVFMLICIISLNVTVTTSRQMNSFMLINTCVCRRTGYNLTFQCTTIGPGNTIWMGSAFDCTSSNDELSLEHSLFSSPGGANQECGNITVHSLSVENDHYTSQVSIPFSLGLLGQWIQCTHDNASDLVVVGSSTISVTAEPFPPPSSITLAHVQPGPMNELTFNWTRVAPDCIDIQYSISSNCGQCPTITNLTMVTCQGVEIPTSGRTCSFMVKTVVCGNSDSNGSTYKSLHIKLKVPDTPKVVVYPLYSAEMGRLISLETQWMELTTFNITDGLSGSAISFNITYTDAATGYMCSPKTILHSAESCVTDLWTDPHVQCVHSFDVSSSSCKYSNSISVIISATNLLGMGPLSNPTSIYGISDYFVNVTVEVASSAVICVFHSLRESHIKTCSVTYGTSKSCGLTTFPSTCGKQSAENVSNVVIIGLPSLQNDAVYHYVVTASNGTYRAQIQGNFSKGAINKLKISFQLLFIILVPTLSLLMLLVIIGFTVSTRVLIRKQRQAQVEFIQSQVMEIPTANEDGSISDSKQNDMEWTV